jgi:hypothetical protein
MTKVLLILAAISLSTTAFAQSAPPPMVGNKPLMQVKPRAPMGCKLVGTVKGTKLWAGDCTAPESTSASSVVEPAPLPPQTTGVVPPDQKN